MNVAGELLDIAAAARQDPGRWPTTSRASTPPPWPRTCAAATRPCGTS